MFPIHTVHLVSTMPMPSIMCVLNFTFLKWSKKNGVSTPLDTPALRNLQSMVSQLHRFSSGLATVRLQ